jgi:sugar phosphate isomerase/epimerase
MALTRRQLLAGAAVSANRALAQFRPGNGPKVRTSPAVCLYSQVLIKIGYDELGPVLRSLGLDGCDLSVQAGGHVVPAQAPVDMMRSVEAITGVGLDVPIITTAFTSLADPATRNVLAICGEMGVPLFRTGVWKYSAAEPEARLAEVQRDILGLASLARAVNMGMAIPNVAGENIGASTWDLNSIIRGIDPRTVGYSFDPGYAQEEGGVGGAGVALRLAGPKLKAVTVRDFTWVKDGSGAWKPQPCPLGEGMVPWAKFFQTLARLKFTGPITLPLDYQPQDELGSIKRDAAFVRKQISAAYGG